MTRISKTLGALAVVTYGLAQASPVPAIAELGVIGNTPISLELFRSGEFVDIFNFEATGGGFGLGAAVGTLGFPDFTYGVNLGAGVLYDAAFTVLAQDLVGSDGLSVGAVLDTAGTYRFAVLGNTLPSGGTYFVGILPVVQAVPEPTAQLLALGAVATRVSARKRKQKQVAAF